MGSAEVCRLHVVQGPAAALCVSPVLVPEQYQLWGMILVISTAAQSRQGDSLFETGAI